MIAAARREKNNKSKGNPTLSFLINKFVLIECFFNAANFNREIVKFEIEEKVFVFQEERT